MSNLDKSARQLTDALRGLQGFQRHQQSEIVQRRQRAEDRTMQNCRLAMQRFRDLVGDFVDLANREDLPSLPMAIPATRQTPDITRADKWRLRRTNHWAIYRPTNERVWPLAGSQAKGFVITDQYEFYYGRELAHQDFGHLPVARCVGFKKGEAFFAPDIANVHFFPTSEGVAVHHDRPVGSGWFDLGDAMITTIADLRQRP